MAVIETEISYFPVDNAHRCITRTQNISDISYDEYITRT
jgi:hypothetical protein